jgi:group I intron endonuclease
MNKPGIYQIKNLVNGKVYVGSSDCLKRRIREHKYWLNKGRHVNGHLQFAWNKYGIDGFDFSILEHCSIDDLIPTEQKWMDKLCVIGTDYNICPIAGSTRGSTHTEEAKAKMSISRRGEANAFYGKKHSDETLEYLRSINIGKEGSNKGKPMSLEARKKSSISKTGKKMGEDNPFFGRTHSDETKEKIRQARIGKSPWNKGVKMSSESVEKNRQSQIGLQAGDKNPFFGKKHSEESKAKMSAAQKQSRQQRKINEQKLPIAVD